MGLAPSGNRENLGKSVVAKVPVPILPQPRSVDSRVGDDAVLCTQSSLPYGNAESYFLIGDALGRAMVQLIREAE